MRTRLVTRLGVSVAKVVATIDVPSSHQGMPRPAKKKDALSADERLATHRPVASVMAMTAPTMTQSIIARCNARSPAPRIFWRRGWQFR